MSFNLVNLVAEQAKGALLPQISRILGDEGHKAAAATDSAIPAMLSGLLGSTRTSAGADNLFNTLQNQDDGLLDRLGSMLGGGQATAVIDQGNSLFANVLGSGGLGKMAGTLAAFTGLSKGGTSSLLGMLAPIVFGVLKRKIAGGDMNPARLARLLDDQQDNIAQAMPQGLSSQLSSAGFSLGNLGNSAIAGGAAAASGVAAGAAALAGQARQGVGDMVGDAREAVGQASANLQGSVQGAAENIGGRISDTAGNVTGAVSDAAHRAQGAVGDMAHQAGAAAGQVGDKIEATAHNAAGKVESAVHEAGDTVRRAESTGGGGKMIGWLLGLAALGFVAWQFIGNRDVGDAIDNAAEQATDAASGAVQQAADVVEATGNAASGAVEQAVEATGDAASGLVENVVGDSAAALSGDAARVGERLTGLFSTTTDAIGGITDVESAQSAIPKLKAVGSQLGSVQGLIENLPESARGPLGGIIENGMGALQPIADKAMAIPGVGDIIQPILGPLMERIGGLL